MSLPAGIPDLTVPRMAVGLVVGSMLMTFHLGLLRLRALTDVEKAMLGLSVVNLIDKIARGGNPGSAARE